MFIDLSFLTDYCNLECVYCSAGSTRWRVCGDRLVAMRGAQAVHSASLSETRESVLRVIGSLRGMGVVGLKLSGGELFVFPRLAEEVIECACEEIETVQVLTNGLRVDGLLRLVGAHKNLSLQVSLDGITPTENSSRTRNAAKTRRVVGNVRRLAEAAPLEVNVVLTKRNLSGFLDLLSFFRGLGADVIVYPFPVRGCSGLQLCQEDAAALDELLDDFDSWSSVLPPLRYMVALRSFIARGRTRACEIPHAISGLDQSGTQQLCPCEDLAVLGSVSAGFGTPRGAATLMAPCGECFSHYEIVHWVSDASEVRQGFTKRLVAEFLARKGA